MLRPTPRPPAALALALLAGCHFDGSGAAPFETGDEVDGALPGEDATAAPAGHLLLSEIKTHVTGEEFLEIHNPGAEAVSLRGYHLADTSEYASLPGFFGAGPAPDVDRPDFIAAFPGSATVAGGASVVVAIDAEGFAGAFGRAPDFALTGAGAPGLEAPFSGAIGNQASLTDGGELIALFYWDGAGDLVRDVDLAHAGADPSDGNQLLDKSGLTIDGPDTDRFASAYAAEAATLGVMPVDTLSDQSYERLRPEDGYEDRGAGNGLDDHDESSEDVGATWHIASTPSPGAVHPALVP